MSTGILAFSLAATIRHDGHGGVLDELDTPAKVDAWIAANQSQAAEVIGPLPGFEVDDEAVGRIVAVRQAVRSLFAEVVSPAPPSRADAHRLMEPARAVNELNQAAVGLRGPLLGWEGNEPVLRWEPREDLDDPLDRWIAVLGRSGIDFLAGPERARLRACPAARCVKYFLQEDPRQTWCSPTCGNRERVNRYYRKHHG
ncbi:CGNR zinc finger domain-containing protein [Kribbella deserti]|uniref:CGNR zinc finger domain-containing protein n=1 Tax=Kribbella deserti TaxID=1926257 RepID=A0ABV6QWY6_9ACTN